MTTPEEQIQNLQEALAILANLKKEQEFEIYATELIKKLGEAIKRSAVSPELIEELLQFFNTNQELINSNLPDVIRAKQEGIRQDALGLVAAIFNK